MNRYCITDSAEVAGRAATAGATMIQVRAKTLGGRELAALTRRVLDVAHGVPVLVNARLDVALACGAQGVHLPSHSIAPSRLRGTVPPGFLIGVSCHSVEDVARAAAEGADFVVFGPVFTTRSHPDAVPTGTDGLSRAVHAAPIPVYALGGVTEANAPLCIEAGAAGVAGISLFL